MSLEEQVRRQLEEQAKAEANGTCPTEGEIDAAFGDTKAGGRMMAEREWLKSIKRGSKKTSSDRAYKKALKKYKPRGQG